MKLAAATIAVLPAIAIAPAAYAAGTGQIEQGDIYRVKNLTTNGSFADIINGACGDTVEYRVVIHNTGPYALDNVKVAATLNSAKGTSHGSTVTLTADNNLENMVVTASAGVNTSKATTADYISGSTQLLGYSATPGNQPVLRNLPDGILSGGVNIGDVGPLTPDTEEVQFQAKLKCEVKPPVTPPKTVVTTLPNTGPEGALEVFAGTSLLGSLGHYFYRRRR